MDEASPAARRFKERVRRFEQYKWLTTRGVNEEEILKSLPQDLRREIQRHLCLNLVRRVPFFAQMDDQLLDAICERLVSSLSTKGSYIVREGDPVNEMLFIIRGQMESSTTNGGRSGFFNSITLRPAPPQHETYYSHQWRTWGACFIQAAWRRYKKKMLAKKLILEENYDEDDDGYYSDEQDGAYSDEETGDGTSVDSPAQNLSTTILASRFAANTRRGALQRIAGAQPSSLKMPKLLKPDEPDFSGEV
ncbi:Cyclic nucleotide-gated ion channel 18 [Sesamum angolense]|uniref:Cyclic nucleotide-gated ion channel 18 n=1 Tax=Sesamum angolense TaxID=2727404 RepID=A0AAE2BPI3_9LAMI|nr:Cyclic nucleotide-gated ion channel 18 [Sesamum angolense]